MKELDIVLQQRVENAVIEVLREGRANVSTMKELDTVLQHADQPSVFILDEVSTMRELDTVLQHSAQNAATAAAVVQL